MEDKKILFYFEQAQKDWSRPQWMCGLFGWNHTKHGLCAYFKLRHAVSWEDLDILRQKWHVHRKVSLLSYHFNNRKERLEAIKKVIIDLKTKDNGRQSA